jgi:hypothetical protein
MEVEKWDQRKEKADAADLIFYFIFIFSGVKTVPVQKGSQN